MNRKTFLYQTSLAASSLLLSKSLLAFTGSPANKVRIAVMGVNSRGHYLATTFAGLKEVEVAYLCDPDSKALAKTINAVEKSTGKKPQGYEDIRKLLTAGCQQGTVPLHLAKAKCRLFPDRDPLTIYREYGLEDGQG